MPSEVEDFLTAKGPGKIPAWGYGVGIAGAFLLFEFIRNRNPSANTANQNAATPPAPGTTTVKTVSSGGGGGQPWPWRPFWTFGPPTPPGVSTNTEWRHVAGDWLASKGYKDGEVNDVLADFLDGQQSDMSREEKRIVDLAVDEWGPPPEGTSRNRGGFVGPPNPMDTADTGAAGPDSHTSGAGRADVHVNVKDEETRRPERRRRRR
jgi:hypothetical protein